MRLDSTLSKLKEGASDATYRGAVSASNYSSLYPMVDAAIDHPVWEEHRNPHLGMYRRLFGSLLSEFFDIKELPLNVKELI